MLSHRASPQLLQRPTSQPSASRIVQQPRWRSRAASGASSFDPRNDSIDYLHQRQRLQYVQSMQQRKQQQQELPPQQPGEESDLLWAGYSALEEQVQKHHRRHEALMAQLQELQAKLHAVSQQPPVTAWQSASFLLFFLFFINFWGLVANFQMGWGLPWMAAKQSAGSLWLKQLLGVAVPLTNTVVVLIFCIQAVKAAWTCLK